MTAWECLYRVAAVGAAGGLLACVHKDSVLLPQFDKAAGVWKPGAIGTVLVGAFAAFLIWSLYSSAASVDIGAASIPTISLAIRELGGSGLVGFCGGKVLTLLAQKQADQIASEDLSQWLKNLIAKKIKMTVCYGCYE